MLGFGNTPNNWDQFWLSFWASLCSGALYSLLIGIFVGLVVWWVQRRSENSELRQQCEREIATFRERLRAILVQPNVNIIEKPAEPPSVVAETIALLTESPLDLWREQLPRYRNFLDSLRVLQQATASFKATYRSLELLVFPMIREKTRGGNFPSLFEGRYLWFFVEKIRGTSDTVLSTLLANSPGQTDQMNEVSSSLQADDEVRQRIDAYIDACKQLETSTNKLKKTLDLV